MPGAKTGKDRPCRATSYSRIVIPVASKMQRLQRHTVTRPDGRASWTFSATSGRTTNTNSRASAIPSAFRGAWRAASAPECGAAGRMRVVAPLLTALLLAHARLARADFAFPSFAQNSAALSALTLVGAANVTAERLRLTPAVRSAAGAVWYARARASAAAVLAASRALTPAQARHATALFGRFYGGADLPVCVRRPVCALGPLPRR